MVYIMEKNALNIRQNAERCTSQSICDIADMEHLSMSQMAYRPGNLYLRQSILKGVVRLLAHV